MTPLLTSTRNDSRSGVIPAVWLCALWVLAGCVSPWERSSLLKDDRAEIGSVQGPTERRLRGLLRDRGRDEVDDDGNLLKPIVGTEEYLAAEELYKNEQYAAAEKAFKAIANGRKFKKSEIREDALFMQAEAAFEQERYSKAHDLYARLLKDYPTTRHLDKISGRMFKIAMIWLDHPQIAQVDQIQQVNHEKYGERLPPAEPVKQKKRNVLTPNFTDDKRPLFDPHGNALSALRSIWTNDPTGPLADDALMLAASYHARAGDFIEADRHYTMLREQFPNSPHVQKAFEIGAHVKLMSYQGAPYDGKTLTDAEQLKLATLRLYPEMENKPRLEAELAKIEQAKSDRYWAMIVFYERKGFKKAAATYCHMLLNEHPKSRHAPAAREKLAQFGPAYADGRALLSPYPDPPRTLISSIFPPDDHGGVPMPPPPSPINQNSSFSKDPNRWRIVKPADGAAGNRPGPTRETASDTDEDSPRTLPEDADDSARPAPAGKSRLNDDGPAFDDPDNDDDSGHTQL